MSNGEDVREMREKRLNTESEAEYSMVSGEDQLKVEEREKQREKQSRARRSKDPDGQDNVPDPDHDVGTRMPSDRRG